jgi:hypothetical protein
MSLEIRKILVLSTIHVTAETAAYLNNTDCQSWPKVGGPYSEYGWVMSAHPNDELDRELSEDLAAVFSFAQSKDCSMVLFDRDAEVVEGLKTYEW